jgi:NDP-sugar pyrophosphorylase family protein
VTNGDVLTTLSFSNLLRFHKEQQAAATIAAHLRQVKIDFGVIQWFGAPVISGYIEKPAQDYSVSMGVYVFDPRVIKYIPRGEYLDFPDLVRKLIESGERVVGYSFDGYWQDLGRPDDYERAMQDFERMRSDFLPEE